LLRLPLLLERRFELRSGELERFREGLPAVIG